MGNYLTAWIPEQLCIGRTLFNLWWTKHGWQRAVVLRKWFVNSVLFSLSSVQFSRSVVCHSFATSRTAACQASLSITNSRGLLKLMCIDLVMPSNHLILCRPLLLLPSNFPSIRVFSSESVLHIRWSKYWSFSFSISLSSEHPDGLVGSPCSPRDSQESSPAPQFKSINSSSLSFLYGPTLTSIRDYWKNHSFDDLDLCQQSDVSAL